LGHRPAGSQAHLLVETYLRSRRPAPWIQQGDRHAAFLVALSVTEQTRPRGLYGQDLQAFNKAILATVDEAADNYQNWATLSWPVDGKPVRFRLWEFASGWGAFTTALPDADVLVYGGGCSPGEPSLARIDDTSPYGFVDNPIALTSFASSSLHPETALPTRSRDLHPDHRRVLAQRNSNPRDRA
jgi:hypothetical protein